MQKSLVAIMAWFYAFTMMTSVSYGQDQKPTSVCNQMLGNLHEGLVLGIDERKLWEIAPECSNKPYVDREQNPEVYSEFRDNNGLWIELNGKTARDIGNQGIGEMVIYQFRQEKLSCVKRLSGREDHEAFARFGAAFEEIKSP